MGITAKEQEWKLGETTIEIDKKMTSRGPRKIELLSLQIKMPPDLKADQLKTLKEATNTCPVLRSINGSIKIKVNWSQQRKKKKTCLNFLPINAFRETPQVTFFDAGVKGANCSDVVIHHGNALSPPNDDNFEQYYVHRHQIDHNLVLEGGRTFTLLNPAWDEPHHVIYMNPKMGALEIPRGTFHRSVSGKKGSIVLNQAIRDIEFDPSNEFEPVSLRDREDLRQAKTSTPVYWIWHKGKIKRLTIRRTSRTKKIVEI